MAWDPAATKVLVMAGGMWALVVAVYLVKRKQPEDAPLELAYSEATWGHVLQPGEHIQLQVPALQPASWWLRFQTDPTRAPLPTRRQLALTSQGALLLAERGWGGLRGRDRFPMSDVALEDVRDEGQYYASLRLRTSSKKIDLYRVPRVFVERLRSAGARVSGAA
jgi:hypothetical protein